MNLRSYGGWSGLLGGSAFLAILGGVLTEHIHYKITGKVPGKNYYENNYWDWDVFLLGAGGVFAVLVVGILLFG